LKKIDKKITVAMKDFKSNIHYKIGNFNVWFSGYILNNDQISFLNKVAKMLDNDLSTGSDFDCLIRSVQGHFSCIISNKEKLFCCVDRVRTIPIFYALSSTEVIVSNYAPDISTIVGVNKNEYNKQAILEISMSGYTIGKKTLHPQISQLCAGELLIVRDDKVEVREYYRYSPWKVKERNKIHLKKELTEVSRTILEDMVKSADGRQFVVPLSAGNDSRFIVSGLKELGVKDVICFSYGVNNNFEVRTAKDVANHLSYKWLYIPLSLSNQKKYFSDEAFNKYCRFSDTLSNSPILIDYSALNNLSSLGCISNDAIFVNGNSGDFITGGHVLSNKTIGSDCQLDTFLSAFIDKHYSLWNCLQSDDNINNIKNELSSVINKLKSDYSLTDDFLWAIFENIEWAGRQSKFVTATQRNYEFHGYDWRLPLWDSLYMDFWEGVPKEYKLNQSLYIETLRENNWGGVWHNIEVNSFTIASSRIRSFRNFMKLFFVFFGKDAWHKFDRKYFNYFVDNTAATAIVPYSSILFDQCGARNRNSWMVKKYLFEKEININKHKFI
jgi:asparagine synthase (glutamine-hydrolysing)